MNGFMGRILRVDLTDSRLWDEALDEGYTRGFVGGSGLGARYLYDRLDVTIDPLGSENPLLFLTGPLVGTSLTSAGRYCACARSPLTGIWGEANSGGFFGPELRYAGYDGVLITGRADQPVWLAIIDGQATLHPANDLWGSDPYTTQANLRQELGDERVRVSCIGLAGENRVRLAGIANDHGRFAARTGLGAVMGSKNLKAIAVRGHEEVPLYAPKDYKALTQRILGLYKDDFFAQSLRQYGTAGGVNLSHMLGDMPILYFQLGEYSQADDLSGVDLADKYLNRNTACHKCVIACGRETHTDLYNDPKVDGPEYETVAALGSLLMIFDLPAVIHAGHLCNRYGLDVISMGVTIGLACELFTRGLLTAKDTEGLEIHYGDPELVFRLIEMTARREGFGDVLADGNAALADWVGVPELSATVNRLEVPMHDPRAYVGMAVTYALSPRGACHMEGDMFTLDLGQEGGIEIGLPPGDRQENSVEKGRMAARTQAWRNLYNSLILCQFENPPASLLTELINAATGWNLDLLDLIPLGKRIVNIKRLLNFKLGLTKANDRLPELLLQPLNEGGTQGIVPDMPTLLAGAYEELGWDPLTGRPLGEVL
ncbi:MAG: aldehyde ferredoxin oxidoreductase [Anaerolineales bacterium]|nr:aldehyde ferredoxin oxidoreductase [Anaerolineae bacterium]PWB49562.1 MAG: aldehyde ferredoxin oxidoreductase [Anaerolineales bacterium]